jgi:hypothetical protein
MRMVLALVLIVTLCGVSFASAPGKAKQVPTVPGETLRSVVWVPPTPPTEHQISEDTGPAAKSGSHQNDPRFIIKIIFWRP